MNSYIMIVVLMPFMKVIKISQKYFIDILRVFEYHHVWHQINLIVCEAHCYFFNILPSQIDDFLTWTSSWHVNIILDILLE